MADAWCWLLSSRPKMLKSPAIGSHSCFAANSTGRPARRYQPEPVRFQITHMQLMKTSFQATGRGDGVSNCAIISAPIQPPESGEVQVELHWSAINYKDALCATGNPGVARNLPIIPGIDAAGVVAISNDDRFKPGDRVLIIHAKFGTEVDGAFSTSATVPGDWLMPLPKGLDLQESMILGTAGFTAAQCIEALIHSGVQPASGPIVVTGSTGGVGSMSVAILGALGFDVTAVSGKPDRYSWLRDLGAAETIGREAIIDKSSKPLLSAQWAGAVDTVGGETLASIIRSTKTGGCVTACGLVGGNDLSLTVFPFILRGVCLQGIDSANVEMGKRERIWKKLAGPWKIKNLQVMQETVSIKELSRAIRKILDGKVAGRILVDLRGQ